MKCLYCEDGSVAREKIGLPKCNKCKALYYYNNRSDELREIIFFVTVNDKDNYRIDHNFEDNSTLIYEISVEGKYIKMKIVFKSERFNLTPYNAQSFFKNKLKLYQLFS